MLELRQHLKTASVSNKGGEKESDRLKKELDKARLDMPTASHTHSASQKP